MARLHMKSLLKVILVLTSCVYCIECFAVMSVDFGGEFIKIAIVKPGVPMEIVLNKESQRKTPTVVSMRNGERLMGEPALAMSTKFPSNAFKYLPTILGKKFSHPYVSVYRERFPYYDMVEDTDTDTVIFKLDGKQYRTEELIAMCLERARESAEAFVEQSIKDIVITVPAYYNQAERRAMARAVQMLNMNLLQLITDNAAVALNFGVFRRKNFNSTAQIYMFYDMGATSTTASIVSYQVVKMKDRGFMEENPQFQILGVGVDQTLGGLAFQLRLRDHLMKAFNGQNKINIDVSTKPRAMAKLFKEAGRIMKVLSANTVTFAQIEGLVEDIDFKFRVTREDFETMCSDLFNRVSIPVNDALLISQLTMVEVKDVILMGGGTRIPKVQEMLTQVTGRSDLGKSINTDEAAAMGAVYQAAYLSKGYKVKRFVVKEATIYPIQVEFERVRTAEDGSEASRIVKRTLFGRMNPFPQKKVMTFNKHVKDFGFNITYGDLSFLPKDELTSFGGLGVNKIELSGVSAAHDTHSGADSVSKGVKAHFRMDESGILTLDHVEAVFEKEVAPEEESTLSKLGSTISNLFSTLNDKVDEGKVDDKSTEEAKPKSDDKSKDETKEEKKTADEKGQEEKTAKEAKRDEKTNEKAKENGKPDEKLNDTVKANGTDTTEQEKTKPKPVLVRENITVTSTTIDIVDPSDEVRTSSKDLIVELRRIDEERRAYEKAKNELESFIINTRDKLYQSDYETCSTEHERELLHMKFSLYSDWLDENGDTAKKEELTSKLSELTTTTTDLFERVKEFQERPRAIEALKGMLNHTEYFYKSIKNLTKDEPIFTDVEMNTLDKLINDTSDWLKDARKRCKVAPLTEKPPVTIEDFAVKFGALDREVKYLVNKAKNYRPLPKPKPAETNGTKSGNDTATNSTTEEAGNDDVTLEPEVTEAEQTAQKAEEKKEADKKAGEEKKEEKVGKADQAENAGDKTEEPLQLNGADSDTVSTSPVGQETNEKRHDPNEL